MISRTTWMEQFFQLQEELVSLLRELTVRESPTTEKAAVDRLGEFVADRLRDLGARVERIPQETVGDHWIATWGDPEASTRILTLCHLDTVWPLGTLTRMPIREENGRLYGPGVFDMKGGIAILLGALQGLRALNVRPPHQIRMLFTSDEETGSETSRPLIEEEARRSHLVLCLEPALPDGSLKTFRKGVGDFVVVAHGRSAHAGADPQRGVNAIEELAYQIMRLHGLADPRRGTTVTVGWIQGGTRPNVVPEYAEMVVDVRVATRAEMDRIEKAFRNLRPVLDGARVEVRGGFNRPPMERNPLMVSTFERARAIAAELGLTLTEGGTGGGSDANFTAALGIPTLDGLGAIGNGAHALDEHVRIDSLPPRAALVAALLARWTVL
ncbi:M20 family metallopeptidase [Thermoflexus sp.]|uniref:M20 family metallopeptidase n=1 Tax=Thermoflexus sp. TaxID=1969742 RepID=UPI0025DAACCA|nr:M20 family metallopeptidase [Thermoflexus sp.]MDW8179706.1 M20 family metallopeptidase [Anaerolineae bacterium]MCS6963957.1 M20 family metallopeptidase [Thermoflexus sp.]MCS7350255.1 M20 family metallopeptidase [Thermoflexus sp.]MCX7690802.1 M20 family metallopeptidase [Thermoflexus sp.]MDW8184311.1 M20 family metallopeptidase [Anaerolineae bacterium]